MPVYASIRQQHALPAGLAGPQDEAYVSIRPHAMQDTQVLQTLTPEKGALYHAQNVMKALGVKTILDTQMLQVSLSLSLSLSLCLSVSLSRSLSLSVSLSLARSHSQSLTHALSRSSSSSPQTCSWRRRSSTCWCSACWHSRRRRVRAQVHAICVSAYY